VRAASEDARATSNTCRMISMISLMFLIRYLGRRLRGEKKGGYAHEISVEESEPIVLTSSS